MQSRGTTDLPYWPSQNTYVYKEVWVHSSSRWLWLMEDLLPAASAGDAATHTSIALTSTTTADGTITMRLTAIGTGIHRYALRTDNLRGTSATQTVTLRAGVPATIAWTAKRVRGDAPWTAVVIEDDNASRRRELFTQ